jgi:hypothetical protein
MPVPFYTLATRVIHYGRYGSGAEDPRLFPLYVGYPDLVRGYDVNSFDVSECAPTAASQCPAFDRMLGSRLLVGNIEFRFPLLRPFGCPASRFGSTFPGLRSASSLSRGHLSGLIMAGCSSSTYRQDSDATRFPFLPG